MYTAFFGLERPPFSIAPDPRTLFLSERHREALAHLLYGLDAGGGFVLLTGEVGTGKTTVCRCFLQQIPAHCTAAYIFNPKLSTHELLATICDEFGVARAVGDPAHPSIKECVDPLNAWLLEQHAAGRNCVLVIDEAQSLSGKVLEQLRLLTNLETDEKKLLQIILIGQPELRRLVARPELTQLAQRVIARYHLGPLAAPETAQYVAHRLAVAGWQGPLPFTPRALARVHALSGGVPRRINLLCDRAMLAAYAGGTRQVDARLLRRAAREVFAGGQGRQVPRGRWLVALLGVVAGVALAAGALAVSGHWPWALARAPASGNAPAPSAPSNKSVQGAAAPQALATWLAAQPADESRAWHVLARLWGADLAEGALPCDAPLPQGLQCWSSTRGDAALLRQLDRPVLLRLAPGAAGVAVVLRALQGERATLLGADGTERTLAWSELAPLWPGGLSTLWRGPPPEVAGADDVADAAATPAGSRWLARQLDRAGVAAAPSLRERVQQLQRAQDLRVDGLAGPLTLMRLNRLLAVDEPRLLAPTAAVKEP